MLQVSVTESKKCSSVNSEYKYTKSSKELAQILHPHKIKQ
jgi:hypothetical protein